MITNLFYKEWLKVRYAFLAITILGLSVLAYVFLDINSIIVFNNANSLWSYIIDKGFLYYDLFRYIPLIAGLVLGLFQFFPELSNKKLKLTLHLPMKEEKILFSMQLFSIILLSILFFVWIIILIAISSFYFPAEFTYSMLFTILPWFLAGYYIYFVVSAVLVEPLWLRRVVLVIANLYMISIYLENVRYEAFLNITFQIVLLVIFSSMLILWSGRRFKTGVSRND